MVYNKNLLFLTVTSALGNSFPELLPLPRDNSLTVPLEAME